jgi:hypothetical protein
MSAVVAPSPRSWRRVALFGLGAIVSAALIALGALMLLVLVARHSFTTSLSYAGVRSVVVHSGAGDVSLKAAPAGGAVRVTEDESESLFKPKVHSRLAADGTLTLSASCPGRLSCGVHFELSVPPDVAVQVSSGFGDIVATGLTSTSSIRLDTTAGDIRANGLSAPDVRLGTGVGSLTASLAQPARRLDAGTVAGALKLTVPNTSYALRTHTSLGHVSDGAVSVDPAAPRSIDAHSSIGDITIAVSPAR